MGLLSPTFGYALTEGRFVSTEDGGKNWHDLTPVDAPAATLRAGYFFDQARAWALVYNDATDKLVVYRSASGGASWRTVELPDSYVRDIRWAAFDFVAPTTGWLTVVTDDGSTQLFRTTDGGGSWAALHPSIGHLDATIDFLDATHGWLLDRPRGPASSLVQGSPGMPPTLKSTQDGGATWTAVPVRLAGAPAAGTVWPSTPTWSGTTLVMAAVAISVGRVTLMALTREGSRWVSHASIPLRMWSDSSSWTVDAGTLKALVFAVGMLTWKLGTTTWTELPANGLGTASPSDLSFSRGIGWALAGEKLFSTADGGRSFTQLQP